MYPITEALKTKKKMFAAGKSIFRVNFYEICNRKPSYIWSVNETAAIASAQRKYGKLDICSVRLIDDGSEDKS